ncbi:Holliday junction resolvase RecU [Alteribacter populi]|uniref:Holliday junction resolvase RecU n=1 Tax=Alteribacter populi TaxID=2011011 RepID=UPI000BBAF1F0|nr:Holliday junction resolvase RecU [Alteribacter populi]
MKHGQGNRGQAFEMTLNLVNQLYKNNGVALINKRPTPVKVLKSKGTQVLKGFYESKSTVDYDGCYEGQAVAFEAKSVSGKRFDLKNIHDHQLEYLERAQKHGAISFLLVEFRDVNTVYYISLSFIKKYLREAHRGGRKSIPLSDFEIYAYEVERGRAPLDYLAVIDRINEEKAVSM